MPRYDYQCEDCDFVFEELVKMKGAEQVRCPRCDSPRVKQQFPTGIAVKFDFPLLTKSEIEDNG